MNKKYIIAIVLLIYTLIIFLPPLLHGYVYPNNGDDTAFHLIYFDRLQVEGYSLSNYLGQDMIGKMLLWINKITWFSMDKMYLWFNYIVLWLVGISCFALVSKAIEWKAGLIAIPVVMFMTPSTLNLFDTGAIYDLATVGVIVPLFLLCVVMYAKSRKWEWLVPAVLMAGFAFAFHSMVIGAIFGAESIEPSPHISEFIIKLMGFVVAVVLFVLLAMFIYKPALSSLDKKMMVLLSGLGGLVVLLATFSFSDLTSYSYRFAIDLAIIMALLTACLLGVIVKRANNKMVLVAACALVVAGSIPMWTTYSGYNSAVKPIDMEAIGYVNSLPGEYFSVSSQVAPWIYGRYIDKEYKDGELPYIYRNEPMTQRTTETTPSFWGGNLSHPESTMMPVIDGMGVKVFIEGELEVTVVSEILNMKGYISIDGVGLEHSDNFTIEIKGFFQ
ncbi:hypothetical protein LCGC14_1173750 [marine sediment metagenome]|uniref:Glycosyltransferase RgtA/B/C/D-like domain-containing protein n=1 Tax=marine sediment metagenome TaxID=412755 RepID=A0A0F9MC17_9ZZZZ